MTNETTASQPKSIGDDAKFVGLLKRSSELYNMSAAYENGYGEATAALVSYLNSKLDSRAPAAQSSATIQAVPTGMHAAADLIDAKAQKYLDDHADTENDTGDVVFHYGEAGRDYHSTLVELAEELRRAATIQEPVMVAEPVGQAHLEPVGHVKDYFPGTEKAYRQVVWADRTFAMDVPNGAPLYAAPMVADPAGVARFDFDEWFDEHSMGVQLRLSKEFDEFKSAVHAHYSQAATVKAVPSEAVDADVIRWTKFSDRLPAEDSPIFWRDGKDYGTGYFCKEDVEHWKGEWFAAPLADKTDGGA